MIFVSGGLKQKGVLNALPDLADLQEGDLRHKIDFKQVYASLLKNWLQTDDLKILGRQFDYLPFL